MIYTFKCKEHREFEIRQGMMDEHKAYCPKCGRLAQRVYLPIIHYWPDVLWNKDGSKQSPDELPPVPNDKGKWTHGWSP